MPPLPVQRAAASASERFGTHLAGGDTDALAAQRALVAALCAGARASGLSVAEPIETHISFVLLVGDDAFKIKKAVDLGFVDFRALARRRFFCEEELRLNRRLASALYLDVVPVTGDAASPRLGGDGEAIEWAVRMRAFAQRDQWDRMARDGRLEPAHVDALARIVARFHLALPAPRGGSVHGDPANVGRLAQDNLDALDALLAGAPERALLARLRDGHAREWPRVAARAAARNRDGFVRECHGDLHLGNVAQFDGVPVVFDCIEFNDAFRWIDVASEVAFLVMDLLHRGRPELAARFLNDWLELTGDYAGLALLPFYLRYRALVRAKVAAIRAAQRERAGAPSAAAWDECRADMALAEALDRRPAPWLIAMHGVSGSGKTRVSQALLEAAGAVRVRSDVERKRAHGLAADDHGGATSAMYSERATADTYERLARLAGEVLGAGFTVIVDATFLERARRTRLRELARAHGVRFAIVDVRAPEPVLRERVSARHAAGTDASDADLRVLDAQLASREPVDPSEADCVRVVDNVDGADLPGFAHDAWSSVRAGEPDDVLSSGRSGAPASA
ncbi:MAG: AAA family ATPase [Burkholderiaceae bacterium]